MASRSPRIGRMRSSIDDFDVFWRNTGIVFLDSPDGLGATYGAGTNVDIDDVVHGVIAKSLNSPGFEFANLIVGGNNGIHPGVNMIWLPGGRTACAPRSSSRVARRTARGPSRSRWTPASCSNGISSDSIRSARSPRSASWRPRCRHPASSYVSNMPTVARVSISGGSVQDIQIGGRSTGSHLGAVRARARRIDRGRLLGRADVGLVPGVASPRRAYAARPGRPAAEIRNNRADRG